MKEGGIDEGIICKMKYRFLLALNNCCNNICFQEMRETNRFQTLVNYFTNPQEFQIEFMVACMQFINIVVHSVEVDITDGVL